ncbi:hypothetical protein CTAYLR_004208 [Chrysophaeum taylorii]|uniref:Glutathione transferase n=1 Tax=Chrysophaeum taylorii TaxID=2483200 RepID=A0AAD7XLA9_9STRA|nr:hypothetical protein CTAYLR_004208 [Chrysophaeum taylorii]
MLHLPQIPYDDGGDTVFGRHIRGVAQCTQHACVFESRWCRFNIEAFFIVDEETVAYLQAGWRRWFFGEDVLFEVAQREAAALVRRAATETWSSDRGILAQIILLDQVSRCAFRGTAEAYAYDSRASELAKGAPVELYSAIERFFVCLALSHAEDVALNWLHVEIAGRIGEGAPPEIGEYFKSIPGFPNEHWDAVRRFGRFPHRNAVLGRESTPDEVRWLEDPPAWARSQSRATFVYWNGRGLGDPVRFLLEFCLVPYDEELVTTRDQFQKRRPTLAFGQVPLLEIDGLRIVQTQAILRYVAGKKNLRGSSLRDEARCDAVVNAIMDARAPLITARFKPDPAEALRAFLTATFPTFASHIEHFFIEGGGGGPYVCGAELTYADVCLFEFLEYAVDEGADDVVLANTYPRLADHRRHMRAFPHLVAYLAKRKPKPDAAFVRQVCAILAQ